MQKYFSSVIFSVAVDLVSRKSTASEEKASISRRRSLLDDYLSNPKLDLYDVVGMACDLLLAGVDTVCIWNEA